MEDFEIVFTPADLEFGPVAETGEKSFSGVICIAVIVIGIVLGAVLYQALKEEFPKREKL